ncbi:MAG: hypothetical protein QG639_818 [Patescibacteria group bacterium]|jgi:hypothetical protein|nr:hypothetical protein [Patescibacteria group bacterium]
MKKRDNHRYTLSHGAIWAIGVGAAFVIGLLISVVTFNWLARKEASPPEITFVTPRQAILFWQTEKPSIGYVTYGTNKYQLNQRVEQTSSVPSVTHAVVLDDVPLEGMYYSIHTTADSTFLWPSVYQMHFDPTTLE